MKVVIYGPLSARNHLGEMVGFAPDQLVEVDDDDEKAVAWARGWASTPHGELVEDAKAKEPEPSEPSLADLREQADAKGLPTYGTKAQLQERLAQADKGK